MKNEDPRAERWRALLDQTLTELNMSRSELARRLGRSPAQVSQWITSGNRYGPPEPDVVFAIEDELGCRDMLSSVLGYVRAGDVRPITEAAIEADPDLLPVQKQTLLAQLESSRQVALARRNPRPQPPV